jgi:hypothetical protein
MPRRNKQLARLSDRDDSYEAQFKEMFSRIVEEKVQEALADQQSAIFEPFFRPREISAEIRRRQTVTEQQKWSYFFETYGCLICQEKTFHQSLGMCSKCYQKTGERLRTLIDLHTPPDLSQRTFPDTMQLAREALAPSIEILQREKPKGR